jgi:hypothetical protein
MDTPTSATNAASANPMRDKPMMRTMIISPLKLEICFHLPDGTQVFWLRAHKRTTKPLLHFNAF